MKKIIAILLSGETLNESVMEQRMLDFTEFMGVVVAGCIIVMAMGIF